MNERILVAGGRLQDRAAAVGETANTAQDDSAGGDFDSVRTRICAGAQEDRPAKAVGIDGETGNVVDGGLDVRGIVADDGGDIRSNGDDAGGWEWNDAAPVTDAGGIRDAVAAKIGPGEESTARAGINPGAKVGSGEHGPTGGEPTEDG